MVLPLPIVLGALLDFVQMGLPSILPKVRGQGLDHSIVHCELSVELQQIYAIIFSEVYTTIIPQKGNHRISSNETNMQHYQILIRETRKKNDITMIQPHSSSLWTKISVQNFTHEQSCNKTLSVWTLLKHIKNHYWNKCVRNVQKTLFQSIFIPILTVSVIWIQIGTWGVTPLYYRTLLCYSIYELAICTGLPLCFIHPPPSKQLKLLKTSRRNIIVLFPIEEDVTGLIQKSTIHLHMHPPLLCNLICSLPLVELVKSLLDLLSTEWPSFLHSVQQDLSAKTLARCPKKQTKPLVLILGL